MTCYVPSLTEKDIAKLALAIQQLAAGRSNATGSVTLTLSAATTTVSDPNCAAGSTILLSPTTANAAAAVATTYVSATANGSFTLSHTSSTTAGRTFSYAIVG
jgi:hypothetical protein